MIWIEKIFSRRWAQPAKNWVAGSRLTEGGGPHLSKAQKARLGKRELTARRKSDPVKVALAGDLRSQTTMNLEWIARPLEMGSWTHVSNLLRQ
jgi:hypothetical protein